MRISWLTGRASTRSEAGHGRASHHATPARKTVQTTVKIGCGTQADDGEDLGEGRRVEVGVRAADRRPRVGRRDVDAPVDEAVGRGLGPRAVADDEVHPGGREHAGDRQPVADGAAARLAEVRVHRGHGTTLILARHPTRRSARVRTIGWCSRACAWPYDRPVHMFQTRAIDLRLSRGRPSTASVGALEHRRVMPGIAVASGSCVMSMNVMPFAARYRGGSAIGGVYLYYTLPMLRTRGCDYLTYDAAVDDRWRTYPSTICRSRPRATAARLQYPPRSCS